MSWWQGAGRSASARECWKQAGQTRRGASCLALLQRYSSPTGASYIYDAELLTRPARPRVCPEAASGQAAAAQPQVCAHVHASQTRSFFLVSHLSLFPFPAPGLLLKEAPANAEELRGMAVERTQPASAFTLSILHSMLSKVVFILAAGEDCRIMPCECHCAGVCGALCSLSGYCVPLRWDISVSTDSSFLQSFPHRSWEAA